MIIPFVKGAGGEGLACFSTPHFLLPRGAFLCDLTKRDNRAKREGNAYLPHVQTGDSLPLGILADKSALAVLQRG